MLWGQRPSFNARGLLGAELIKDRDGLYTVVKKETERVLFTGEDDEFGFYEGASIRKINGIYYILFPSDKGNGVHTMSYAVSDYPLGPYEFGGNILENDGCDLRGGNNHGSFCQINNQWYLFYHRGFDNGDFQRRVCVEKIYFDENGKIGDENGNLVKMTNHGFNGALDPYQNVGAVYATRVRVDGYIADDNGGVDWLSGQGNDEENIDTYCEFVKNIDTVIMGFNTYHQIVTQLSPDEWVYEDFLTYVITHKERTSLEKVKFVNISPAELVKKLKEKDGKDVWICGGADIVRQLVNENLIDCYHITVIPTLLGSGIRLFDNARQEIKLRLLSSQSYNGMTDLVYIRR